MHDAPNISLNPQDRSLIERSDEMLLHSIIHRRHLTCSASVHGDRTRHFQKEVLMIPIAAKPMNKAEMIRLAKAKEPLLTDDQLAARLEVSVQQVRQALASRGVPLKRGLRA
jgi:hypothetical protein